MGIAKAGWPSKLPDDELKLVSDAIVSWMSISQISSELEKKAIDMHAILGDVLKFKMRHDTNVTAAWLWKKLKQMNASMFQFSKEEMIELWQQMWMIHRNPSDWFDSWESFLLKYGFASKVNGITEFSAAQKRQIFIPDQTNFSLDGSNGGRGGCPAVAVTINGVSQPGTSINKTSVSHPH